MEKYQIFLSENFQLFGGEMFNIFEKACFRNVEDFSLFEVAFTKQKKIYLRLSNIFVQVKKKDFKFLNACVLKPLDGRQTVYRIRPCVLWRLIWVYTVFNQCKYSKAERKLYDDVCKYTLNIDFTLATRPRIMFTRAGRPEQKQIRHHWTQRLIRFHIFWNTIILTANKNSPNKTAHLRCLIRTFFVRICIRTFFTCM